MDKTNNQTELPLDLSSETVENSDPIDLKVATALEPTTETTVDKLASTSKEHTPVKPNEQENEHTNGRLEEDLPEGPVDLKKEAGRHHQANSTSGGENWNPPRRKRQVGDDRGHHYRR